VWELELDPAVAKSRALALAREMAVTADRGRGLFANPHYQQVVVSDELSPHRLGETLWSQ
jgi:hypothetical protein